MSKKRNCNVDFIKILACVTVVCVHCIDGNRLLAVRIVYHTFSFPLVFFFMAGGFFLLNKKSLDYSYALKKILSITRVLLSWSCIAVLIRTVTELYYGIFTPATLLTVFTGVFKGIFVAGKLWHFWYLGTLLLIYLLLPIIFRFKNRLFEIWLALILIGAVLQYSSYFLHFSLQQKVVQTLRLWCYLQYFIMGGLIGSGKLDRLWKNMNIYLHCFIAIALTVACVAYRLIMENVFHGYLCELFYDDPFFILWIFFSFTFLLRIPLPGFVCKATGYLSPFIMGVYIVHPLIISVGSEVLGINVFTVYSAKGLVLYFFGVLFASVAISFIIKFIPGLKKVIEL